MKNTIKLFFAIFNCLIAAFAVYYILINESDLFSPLDLSLTGVSGACLAINVCYLIYITGHIFIKIKRGRNRNNHFTAETIQRQFPFEKTQPFK